MTWQYFLHVPDFFLREIRSRSSTRKYQKKLLRGMRRETRLFLFLSRRRRRFILKLDGLLDENLFLSQTSLMKCRRDVSNQRASLSFACFSSLFSLFFVSCLLAFKSRWWSIASLFPPPSLPLLEQVFSDPSTKCMERQSIGLGRKRSGEKYLSLKS